MEGAKSYLNSKTALFAASLTGVIFIALFLYLGINQRNYSYEDSKLIAKEISRKAARETESYFNTSLMIARSLVQRALINQKLGADRQEIVNMIKSSVEKNPSFLSVWTMWESNSYDGKDAKYTNVEFYDTLGNLSVSFFRYNDSIFLEETTPADYLEDYFLIPKETKSEFIIEPYHYQYKGYPFIYYESSVVVPIFKDSVFLGVFGVDINLDSLQRNLSKIRPYKSGSLCLISNKGVIVSHIDTSQISKNIFENNAPIDSLTLVSVTEGLEYSVETISEFTGKKVFRFFYPIKIGQSKNPWSMMVEIPIKEATHRSSQLFFVAFGILILGLAIILFLAFNILDRKRYEQTISNALIEVETRNRIAVENAQSYQEIFNSTSEAIFIHDLNSGEIIDVNDAMLQMYGYSDKSEVLTKTIDSFSANFPPYTKKEATIKIIKAFKEGVQVFEWLAQRKSGENFWIEVSLRSSTIAGVKRVLAVVRDVTERKTSQLAIEQSEKKYRELSELLPQVVWETDLSGKFTYTNKIGYEIFGYTPEDIEKGLNILNVIVEEDRGRAAENIKKILIESSLVGSKYNALRKNGSTFPIEIYASVIYDKNKPSGLRGVTLNISERVNAEKALRESEEKYRTIIENINEVFMMVDNDDRVLYINSKFTEKLGYSPDEIIGKIGYEILLPAEDKIKIINANKERLSKIISQYEATFIAKNGQKIEFLVSGAPILNNEGETIGSIGAMMDITDRKKAEKKLRQSQQLFETLALMSPVGIFRTRADGYTTYVNPKWCELSGLTFTEAQGDGWLNAVHPEDREKTKTNWKLKTKQSEKSGAEYRFLRPDGKIVWVLGNALPEIVDGELKGYIGTITNITEIKNAQEEIAKNEKKFREMADLLPQTIWETDAKGTITYTNKNGFIYSGYSQDDFNKGINIFSLIIPEDRDRARKSLTPNSSKQNSVGQEFTALRKDGSTYPMLAYISPIFENEVLIGVRGISIDMTEAKKAQRTLTESEARYRSIIEAFPDIIMISDTNGKIIFANEELQRITGITPADYDNPKLKAYIYPNDEPVVKKAIKMLLEGSENRTGIIENRFIDSNGNLHWFSGTISKLVLNNKIYLQTITRDITEKKQIEKELEQHRNNLELLVRERTHELEITLQNLHETQNKLIHSEKMASLGVLAAGIAHEINNPLNFIQGGISGLESYMRDTLPEHLPETEPLINAVQEGIRRSAEIVQSLNRYSRKDDFPKTLSSIHTILDSCLVMVSNQTKNRIEIEKEYCCNNLNILCNEGQIHQVFLNIIVNAIHAIENMGIIKISTKVENSYICVQITDNGCGISEDNLLRIIDPFFTTKEPGKGTGLGLSITYNIINEHNGSMEFESEINIGTTVTIKLPLKQ